MLRKGNPDRLMATLNGAENTAATGAGSVDGQGAGFAGTTVVTPITTGVNEIRAFAVRYLEALDVVISFHGNELIGATYLKTFSVADSGELTLLATKSLSAPYFDDENPRSIAYDGNNKIGVAFKDSLNEVKFYEATISAAGAFSDEFTTVLIDNANNTPESVTYNATEDRWVALVFDTDSAVTRIYTIAPGATSVEGSDTRTSDVATQKARVVSSHSNSLVLLLDGADAVMCTVSASGGTIVIEDAGESVISPGSAKSVDFNSTTGNHIYCTDSTTLTAVTVSGTVATDGSAHTLTGNIDASVRCVTANSKHNTWYYTGTHTETNAGHGYGIFTESSDTFTEVASMAMYEGLIVRGISSAGDKIAICADNNGGAGYMYVAGGNLTN